MNLPFRYTFDPTLPLSTISWQLGICLESTIVQRVFSPSLRLRAMQPKKRILIELNTKVKVKERLKKSERETEKKKLVK
jgi:hypothetical protein